MAAKPRVNQKIKEALAAIPAGGSFFLEGFTKSDVQRVRNVAHSMGIKVSARRVDQDDVYLAAGVRVWVKEEA